MTPDIYPDENTDWSESRMRYISKPQEIEAIQWIGGPESTMAVRDFVQLHDPGNRHMDGFDSMGELCRGPMAQLWVKASQSWCDVELGGWVIAERNGPGVYPCRADDFASRYEEAPLISDRSMKS